MTFKNEPIPTLLLSAFEWNRTAVFFGQVKDVCQGIPVGSLFHNSRCASLVNPKQLTEVTSIEKVSAGKMFWEFAHLSLTVLRTYILP